MSESRLVALARQARNLQPERRTNTLSELRGRWSDYVNPYQTPPQQLSDLANPLRWPAMAVEGIQTAVETVPRMLQPGYDYSNTRQAAEDAFNVAGVVGAGSLLGTAAKPANAVGTFGGKLGGAAGDLDMSQAARMARAKEMGFDTPMYHVTRNNFDQFEPGARGASFFASSADDAARGAGSGQREWTMNTATEPDRRTPRTIEALGKSSTIDGLALNPRQRAFFSELPETVSLDEYNSALRPKIEQEFGTVPAWLYDEGSVKMPDGTVYSYDDLSRLSDSELSEVMASGVETLQRGSVPDYSYEDAVRTGRDIFGRQIAHWGPGSDEASIARRVSDSGMGGYLVQDEAGVTIAVTDPRNIRSVNAAFDPAKSDSANLLASRGAPVPVEQRRRRDKDEIF